MVRKRIRILEDGTRIEEDVKEEGQAGGGWQPPEHLRSLPEDYITKDTSDPDRAHELDAPHVVDTIAHDRAKAEREPPSESLWDALKRDYRLKPDGMKGRLDQFNIDVRRMKVIQSLVNTQLKMLVSGEIKRIDLKIKHLYYPENNLDKYELRVGNPPSDSDRPKHLKGFDLAIDLLNWPRSIREFAVKNNIELPILPKLPESLK